MEKHLIMGGARWQNGSHEAQPRIDEDEKEAAPSAQNVREGEATMSAASERDAAASSATAPDPDSNPALQVIILGSGGGPMENNTTAFLVRSVAGGWQKGSIVAVDAGVHLAAIAKILETTQPASLTATSSFPHVLQSGPFAGFEVLTACPNANAAHIARSMVDTYLITHPHLDHIAGFVVNTAGLPGGPRPKRLAGLPATIDAFKNHIFNNVIWPNLSDENNGAGLVTYTRLVDGGSPAIGEGDARGYLEVAEGISVKACSVSHGRPIEPPPPHRNSHSSAGTPVRYSSFDASSMTPSHSQQHHAHISPRSIHGSASNTMPGTPGRISSFPIHNHQQQQQTPQQFQQMQMQMQSQQQQQMQSQQGYNDYAPPAPAPNVYDSTTYFLRDVKTGSEVLIFGDVEPDALSSCPRNLGIWQEAAPKIARGQLRAILIECSYDDSQSVDRMFGHLKPNFIAEELRVLAQEVDFVRSVPEPALVSSTEGGSGGRIGSSDYVSGVPAGLRSPKKRKRVDGEVVSLSRRRTGAGGGGGSGGGGSTSSGTGKADSDAVSPRTVRSRFNSQQDEADTPHLATPTAELSLGELDDLSAGPSLPPAVMDSMDTDEGRDGTRTLPLPLPLEGVKIVIIHVKDKLDGVDQGEKILRELQAHEAEWKTGCEFIISKIGQSIFV